MSATSVKLDDTFLHKMRAAAKMNKRSIPKQIEYWTEIGEIVEANPDIPYEILRNALQGYKEAEAGRLTPYSYRKKRR